MQYKIIYRNRNGTNSIQSGLVSNDAELKKICDALSKEGKKIIGVIS